MNGDIYPVYRYSTSRKLWSEYNGLVDPHLKQFFSSPHKLKLLRHNQLIDKNGVIKLHPNFCTSEIGTPRVELPTLRPYAPVYGSGRLTRSSLSPNRKSYQPVNAEAFKRTLRKFRKSC